MVERDQFWWRSFYRQFQSLYFQINDSFEEFCDQISALDFANLPQYKSKMPEWHFRLLWDISEYLSEDEYLVFPELLKRLKEQENFESFDNFVSKWDELQKIVPELKKEILKRKASKLREISDSAQEVAALTSHALGEESYEISIADQIEKHIEQVGFETVVISPGNVAKTYHRTSECASMKRGRTRATYDGGEPPPLIIVSMEDAILKYKRTPCSECFSHWWREKFPNQIEPIQTLGKYEPMVGDKVEIVNGPFASLPGLITSIPESNKFLVNVLIFGRETVVEMPQHYFKFIQRN